MLNSTSQCGQLFHNGFYVIYVGLAGGFCVILFNILIIVTICRTPSLHSNTNYYIASFAVADIFMAVTNVMFPIVYIPSVNANEQNAKLVHNAFLGLTYSSSLSAAIHLAVIAIDRYICILKPFYYIRHMSKALILKLLLFVWSLTIIYLITPSIVYRSDKFHIKCILHHPPIEYYTTAVAICGIVSVIICVCYFRIARVAFERKKAKTARRQQKETLNEVDIRYANGKAAMKSVKFFVAMCGVYFLCYIPPFVLECLSMLSDSMLKYVFTISTFTFLLHSFGNFCIYLKFNKEFRVNVKKQCADCLFNRSKQIQRA